MLALFEHVDRSVPYDRLLSPKHKTYFSCTFDKVTVSLDTAAYTLIVRRRIDLGNVFSCSNFKRYPNDSDFEAAVECFSRRPGH